MINGIAIAIGILGLAVIYLFVTVIKLEIEVEYLNAVIRNMKAEIDINYIVTMLASHEISIRKLRKQI